MNDQEQASAAASRRNLLRSALAAIGVVAATPSFAWKPVPPFHIWVKTLYEAEIARHAAFGKGDRSAAQSDEAFLDLFTPETRALMLASRNRVLPPSEPDGPILHFILGWGALPNRPITLVAAAAAPPRHLPRRGEGLATVDLSIAGNARNLVVTGRLDEAASRWRIEDIDYGSSSLDQTLVGRLKRMSNWPRRS